MKQTKDEEAIAILDTEMDADLWDLFGKYAHQNIYKGDDKVLDADLAETFISHIKARLIELIQEHDYDLNI